jgi:hypothetical protein
MHDLTPLRRAGEIDAISGGNAKEPQDKAALIFQVFYQED